MEETKEFILDIDAVKGVFKLESGISHVPNKKYKILPFVANDSKVVTDFRGVVGAFVRLVNDKQLKPEFDKDIFFENLIGHVDIQSDEGKKTLLDLVEKMFISGDELDHFNCYSLNYIKSKSEEEKIAKFMYAMLVDKELKEELREAFRETNENVLYKLIFKSLPKLSEKNYGEERYKISLPYVQELFKKDIRVLLKDKTLLKDSIQKLLEYYYFFYISQLAIKLNKFEKADRLNTEAIFFTLSWETTSKKRQAYMLGWESLKKSVDSLFSHTITLELINYHSLDKQMDYLDFKRLIEDGMIQGVEAQIDGIREVYSKAVSNALMNLKLDKYDTLQSKELKEIKKLFETVECQFMNSSRKRAYEGYRNWLVFFMQKNFGKRRGSLGYNLNLTEEDIVFFTKIITEQYDGRVRLNTLFEELQKRGIFFDKYSTANVIELFDKLNLLEKKSDSGDAQYVRSIL